MADFEKTVSISFHNIVRRKPRGTSNSAKINLTRGSTPKTDIIRMKQLQFDLKSNI